jgi:asparagine synthase (glutamine-hydrolysing)
MWAFALFDKAKKQLFISRDRFGIKPLYFYTAENNFIFASEIKALLALDHIKPEADMQSVYEFICFGAASDPSANLFKNIHVLPPACNLFVDVRTAAYKTECYYDLKQAVSSYLFPNENYLDTFRSLLQDSISLHLRSDVPVGSALSGGLDSSTVVALAAGRMKNTSFHTFTAAYHEKNIDESDYAKKVVAGYSNIESHIIYPDSKGYWNDLDKLTWYQDLPINSTSMFAQWEVMKLAGQQKVKVLLDGQGSDEILGGYYNFGGIFLLELLRRGKIGKFFHEKNALKENFSPAILNTLGRAAYYFLPPFLQRGVRANRRLGMNFIAPAHKEKIKNIKVPPRGGKTYRQQSLLSTQFGLQDLLRYEDRNSMAFSIESRVPFLDHRLVEFCIALPNEWKIKDGWTKYILRKTAEPQVAQEVAWRKFKMGFLTPQKVWKEQSKKELDQFVNDIRLPEFLDKNYLIGLNSADVTSSSHLSEFWKMISFLKWAEVFKVSFA